MTAQTVERDQQDQAEAEAESSNRIGRALDVAGIVAGVVLGVILFDIVSGGKLTRWARARRSPGKPEGPCEGCGQADGEAPE
jgi:hypothetical protein